MFSAATRLWFERTFAAPTRVQALGWEQIAAGRHALLCAPTGTGKTLAAFLWCIDRLMVRPPAAGVRVVYVSPLKALAHDVERNLRAPLTGIAAAAAGLGAAGRAVDVQVRTGDTPAAERRRQARRPAEILITTPESLFLILGSAARASLERVETIVVDEIHALAGNKRGAHLAVSLERLSALAHTPPQRIGLSATQTPLAETARFLGGDRPVAIVDASERPALDLEVVMPIAHMAAPKPPDGAGGGMWAAIYPQLVRLIEAHRTTIVFVNSRRLAERIAQNVNDLAGDDIMRAHHGSLARARRTDVEQMLARGELRALAATSSLELGIDMQTVDLVVQIESPGSVARGLQRIGRAGHRVGATSRGRIIPKYRGDLLEAAVVARRMVDGEIEPVAVPRAPLDVLAQHIVAMCATEPWEVDALARLIRRAANFRDLSDDALTAVLDMLSGRYPSDDLSELTPTINWDRATGVLTGRRGARMLASVNAGTIPDRGLYAVHVGEGGPRVGELDEEMVHESRPGDVFLLGATSWRIESIARDRVIVAPAPGEPGKMPFWHGERPGRPAALGAALGALTRELAGAGPGDAHRRLVADFCVGDAAAEALLDYVDEQRRATGTVPSDRAITVERFRDELGDWRVCVLSPFGARVHAPWALAIAAGLRRRSGANLRTMWTDDGIALRFAAGGARPPDVAALIPDPEALEELLTGELADSALFAARFRENAARALLLPRRRAGTRTPLWAQRLRAQALLHAARRFPRFPIVVETYRECLQDVFDLPALSRILEAVRSGQLRTDDVTTDRPSPFARSLVFAYVAAFLYEGDAPTAERRAHALTVDRALLADLLGDAAVPDALDPAAVDEVERALQRKTGSRRARHADAIHDLLRRLGDLTAAEIAERAELDIRPAVRALEESGRVVRARIGGEERYLAADDAARYHAAVGATFDGAPPPPAIADPGGAAPDALLDTLLLRWARHRGPFSAADAARRFGAPPAAIEAALARLEDSGAIARGAFRASAADAPGSAAAEFCAADTLAAIRRHTLRSLQRRIAPVPAPVLARFLCEWQGVGSGARGLAALRAAVARLEGLPLPLSDLEQRILPARVADFHPRMLDQLGASGEIVWIGRGRLGPRDGRVALYRRDTAAALLLGSEDDGGAALSPLAAKVAAALEARGASFAAELLSACGDPPPGELEDALWELVWCGLVTNDTFAPLRALRVSRNRRRSRSRGAGRSGRARPGRRPAEVPLGGRWSATAALRAAPVSATEAAHAQARALISRYGVASREAAAAAEVPGGFAAVTPVFRALEERGEIRRGHFAGGLTGAQFADPEVPDRLRGQRDRPGGCAVLTAADPANPYGALLAWPETRSVRPARRAGAAVIFSSGTPVVFFDAGGHHLVTFANADEDAIAAACGEGLPPIARSGRRRSVRIDRIDGTPVRAHALAAALTRAGFRSDYRGLTLEL